MKLLAAILSIFIFSLTAVPCMDKAAITNTEQQSHTNHNQQHSDFDHCSPFCYCSCCSTPIIHLEIVVAVEPIFISLSSFSEYYPDFISNAASSVWQPPRLS